MSAAHEDLESHILEKYDILQKLGKGAYGVVYRAINKMTKEQVAIKKVFDAFHNSTDAQRTFREVMFLKELKGHENVVKMLDVVRAKNLNDLYLIFEFMESDLHAVIKGKLLLEDHKKFIVYQILKGLKYIHSGDIIHRDLKPANVLIDSSCLAKVADFGLARSVASKYRDTGVFTDYIATRWYRAPEIVLGSKKYSKAIDVWSVGCIFAEMVTGRAIFPGKSTIHQIRLIIELLGRPKDEDIKAMDTDGQAMQLLSTIETDKVKSFGQTYAALPKGGQDLLRKMLHLNPDKRITIDEALSHPYLQEFREPEEEKEMNDTVEIPLNDNIKLSKHDYRKALHRFIDENKPKMKANRSREALLRRIGSRSKVEKQTKKPYRPSNHQAIKENSVKQEEESIHSWKVKQQGQARKSREKQSQRGVPSEYKKYLQARIDKAKDRSDSNSRSMLEKHRSIVDNSISFLSRKKSNSKNKSSLARRSSNVSNTHHDKYVHKSILAERLNTSSSQKQDNSHLQKMEKSNSRKSNLKRQNVSQEFVGDVMQRRKSNSQAYNGRNSQTQNSRSRSKNKENYYYKFMRSMSKNNNDSNNNNTSQDHKPYKPSNRNNRTPNRQYQMMQNHSKENIDPFNRKRGSLSRNGYQNNQNISGQMKPGMKREPSFEGFVKRKSNSNINQSLKSKNEDSKFGIYNSKFLYNAILNNNRSKSRLLDYSNDNQSISKF